MSTYATKFDETGVDTLQFAKKNDLANVRIDKLDIGKEEKLPSCLNVLEVPTNLCR